MSIKHLVNPTSGDILFDIEVADIVADNVNGVIPNFDIVLEGHTGVAGPSTNFVVNRFLFEGTDTLGTPSAVQAYQVVSGLGDKTIAIKSADLATTYYLSESMVNPDGVISLNEVTALPTDQAYLKAVINNNNTGIIEIGGINIKF